MNIHKHAGYVILFLLAVFFSLTSCTKFVQNDPPNSSITGQTAFANDASAAAVMTSIYINMINSDISNLAGGKASISYLMGLYSDEFNNYDPLNLVNQQFYMNTLSSQTNGVTNNYFWTELYNEIYITNAIFAGLQNSTTLTQPIRDQITGEAKFMRAFLNFYAVNLYGDIPLPTTTDYRINNVLLRTAAADVYQLIISDLKDAQSKLPDNYLNAAGKTTSDRVRPNKQAATALLARVYLYLGDWVNAESAASEVIADPKYILEPDLNSVFLATSQEAIWQLQTINNGFMETPDGFYYIMAGTPSPYSSWVVSMSDHLLNAFEPNDARYANWVDSISDDNITFYHYPFKYKIGANNFDPSAPITENTMVMRLGEQYLIRAEARAQQEKITEALDDLNAIRSRATLPPATVANKDSLLTAIAHERQVELFSEWGHRWFDLKRTNMLNSVMSIVTPQKGGTWNPEWALLPIPQLDILANQNLKQNPGYN